MPEPVHRIRLREPWATEDHSGVIILHRRFGKPSNLEPDQKVWLVFPGEATFQRLVFNRRELPPSERRWDVSQWMEERNQIDVKLSDTEERTAIITGVCLEIES